VEDDINGRKDKWKEKSLHFLFSLTTILYLTIVNIVFPNSFPNSSDFFLKGILFVNFFSRFFKNKSLENVFFTVLFILLIKKYIKYDTNYLLDNMSKKYQSEQRKKRIEKLQQLVNTDEFYFLSRNE
jgi:hypothetical protein